MQCPVCSTQLTEIQAGGIKVDVCVGGCGGMWFDQLELKQLDEPHESEGQELLLVDVKQKSTPNTETRRDCPKCRDQIMMRHFQSPKRQVAIDDCPECGGIWLDSGELSTIRSLYTSDTERNAHIESIISDTWGGQMEEMRADRERAMERRSTIRNLFGYLAPGI